MTEFIFDWQTKSNKAWLNPRKDFLKNCLSLFLYFERETKEKGSSLSLKSDNPQLLAKVSGSLLFMVCC